MQPSVSRARRNAVSRSRSQSIQRELVLAILLAAPLYAPPRVLGAADPGAPTSPGVAASAEAAVSAPRYILPEALLREPGAARKPATAVGAPVTPNPAPNPAAAPVSTPANEPNATPTAAPAVAAVPVETAPSTEQVLELGDGLERSLTSRQRAELAQFAASLPHHAADPWDDGFLARAGAVLFPTPMEVRLGKVTVSGGLITAVTIRNPFGLLNPEFFGLSW